MRIAIIDDEEFWIQQVKICLEEYFQEKKPDIDTYTRGEIFLRTDQPYEIVVVDIEMPRMDGFEVAKQYKKQFPDALVIILTSHTELSMEGYLVDAFRYIDKLNMKDRMEEALKSAERRISDYEVIPIQVVEVGERNIRADRIIYVETDRRNLLLHTPQATYKCGNTMKELEERMHLPRFFRCHNSYIVNLDYVDHLTESDIFMKDGNRIMVSNRKYSACKRHFLNRRIENASLM